MDLYDTKMEIYVEADKIAKANNQTVGDNNDFYLTLNQLMELLML